MLRSTFVIANFDPIDDRGCDGRVGICPTGSRDGDHGDRDRVFCSLFSWLSALGSARVRVCFYL